MTGGVRIVGALVCALLVAHALLNEVFVEMRDALWFQRGDMVYWSHNRDQLMAYLKDESYSPGKLNCETFSESDIVKRCEIYGRLVALCYGDGSVDIFAKAAS